MSFCVLRFGGPMYTPDLKEKCHIYIYIYMAVSYWYDGKEMVNGQLPRNFAECCIVGTAGPSGPCP